MRKLTLSLVGSAAALLFVGMAPANAADAIVAAVPEPTGNYVQVCDAFGAGYFFIPGSETCLKLSGNVTFSAGYDSFRDEGYSSVEARMDIDTRADSEIGTIGTKIRLSSQGNVDNYTLGFLPQRETDVELAYITAGPLFAGLKESLINQDVLYGDALDLETYFGDLNTTTIGFMADNLGGGFYAGLAVEDRNRDDGLRTISYDRNSPDITGRMGIAGQGWGTADLSGAYSTENSDYFVKATADLTVIDRADFRITGGYGDSDINGDFYMVAAAGKYAFTDKVSGFTGVSYLHPDNTDDVWTANLGATYTLTTGFDVKGEVAYSDWGSDDTVNTKFSLVRSW